MIITYNGQVYQIQNSYTNKPYIYWDYNSPYELVTSNKSLKEMAGRYYLIFNQNGVYTLVPQTDIEMNFAESGVGDLVTEKITGIIQNGTSGGIDEERFSTLEQSLEKIEQTVGKIEEDITGNTQSITQLTQTDEQISAEVSRIEREFSEDKGSKELRDNISVAMLELQSVLGLFSSDMNTYMEDNRLSDVEEEAISSYKEGIINGRLNLISQLDILISALEANGQTDKSIALTTQRDLLYSSVDNLINTIDNACTDKVFTNNEMAAVISYFANVNSKINETKNLVDEYMFVSIGGNLTEQLTSLILGQNEIKLSISRTESVLKNSLNLSKALVQDIINSNNTVLVNFKNCFSTIVSDSEIISEEIDSLNVRIEAMDKEIVNIGNKKEEIINNEMLSEEEKQNLASSYDEFINSYNNLKNKTSEVIADSVVNDVEKIEMNEIVNEYYNQLNNIHSSLCQALDVIDDNTISKEIADAKAEINTEINELNNRINDLVVDTENAVVSGLIDEQEKANILQNLEILNREKIDIDNRFNEWYSSDFLYGDLKESYKQVYDIYIEKYNNLVNLSETIANKSDLVSDEERISMEKATDELNIALDNFLKESEVVVDIATSNEVNYIKNNLSKEFTDVNNTINDLNEQMNVIFKDGIITEMELKDLEGVLIQIDKEKIDIDKTYDELYNNDNLL